MKKKITGSVLSAGAIVLGLAAAGCGGAIENAANGWAMLGYTLLAIVLGCAALVLAGLGLVAEPECAERRECSAEMCGCHGSGYRKQPLTAAVWLCQRLAELP